MHSLTVEKAPSPSFWGGERNWVFRCKKGVERENEWNDDERNTTLEGFGFGIISPQRNTIHVKKSD